VYRASVAAAGWCPAQIRAPGANVPRLQWLFHQDFPSLMATCGRQRRQPFCQHCVPRASQPAMPASRLMRWHVAAHGYFGRLIFQYASFNNCRSRCALRAPTRDPPKGRPRQQSPQRRRSRAGSPRCPCRARRRGPAYRPARRGPRGKVSNYAHQRGGRARRRWRGSQLACGVSTVLPLTAAGSVAEGVSVSSAGAARNRSCRSRAVRGATAARAAAGTGAAARRASVPRCSWHGRMLDETCIISVPGQRKMGACSTTFWTGRRLGSPRGRLRELVLAGMCPVRASGDVDAAPTGAAAAPDRAVQQRQCC
jgi:hypothetical protein